MEGDEHLLGEFENKKKTPWKTFGNRRTDFILITNKKLVNVFLVKANTFGDPDYMVDYIPFNTIEKIELTQQELKDCLKVTFNKNGTTNSLTVQLEENSSNAISLINPQIG